MIDKVIVRKLNLRRGLACQLLTFALILTSFNALSLNAIAQSDNRSINLEWEEVENSTGYEIELSKIDRDFRKKKLPIIRQKTNVLEKSISYGKYEMRIRSLDKRGIPGPWSDPTEFLVQLPSVQRVFPRDKQKIAGKDDSSSDIKFSWKPLPGAKEYRLEIKNAKGEVIHKDTYDETSAEVDLAVAAKFSWRVTAIDHFDQVGEEGKFSQNFYHLGEAIESPEIIPPKSDIVYELEWNRPDHTKSFSYYILRKKSNSKWRVMEKKKGINSNKVPFPQKFPGGDYKLIVRSNGNLRQSSKPASVEFKVRSGERSPAAVQEEKLKTSLELPNQFNFLASYLLTVMSYQFISGDFPGAGVPYNALGGTGRLGIAYTPRTSNLGALAMVDMSGFVIDSKNRTYLSGEIHGMWKHYYGIYQLQVSGGGYFKEFPASVPDATQDNNVRHDKIAVLGPQIGAKLWRPISQKLGLQFNARAYYSLVGMQVPDDRALSPRISLQAGLLGSYRLGEHMMGFMGYAFRKDSFAYEGTGGFDNSISATGHYFNLFLDWGF